MREVAPGWPLLVEDSATHHWIGACGDVVLLFVYDGSQDDVGHVRITTRLVARLRRERDRKLQLLCVLAPGSARPPSVEVRRAIVETKQRFDESFDRAAVVVLGSGFLPAIHRGAITSVTAAARLAAPLRVMDSLRLGVRYVVGDRPVITEALTRFCDERAGVPTVGAGRPSHER